MNEQHNQIETYLNENEVLGRITELRARGLPEDRIFVFSDDPEDSTKLTAETDVNYKSTEGSAGDKMMSMFSSEDPEERVLDKFMDLSESEKDRYAKDLKNGKILLYAEGASNTDSYHDENFETSDMQWDNVYGKDGALTNDNASPSDANRAYADDRETDRVLRDDESITGNSASMDSSMRNNDRSLTDRNLTDKERMELHEEKVDVDKNRRQAGEVEVNKHTEVEKQEFDVPVNYEEVTVERRPVNEVREDDTETKFNRAGNSEDNESIHVPVYEDEVNVNKKDVTKEEIVVNKKEMKDNVHVEEDVRREEADISDSTADNRRNDDTRKR